MFRETPNFRRASVNSFRRGSIIADCNLAFENNTIPPTESEVVRQLLNNLDNGTELGNVTLFPRTIRSGATTVNNLEPISLTISYVIEDRAFTTDLSNMGSTAFRDLSSSVINWLNPVLTSVLLPSTMSNYTVMFSNDSTMVQVSTNVQINTTAIANPQMLLMLLSQNVSDSGFDIVISSIIVNGMSLVTDRFPLQLRFTNLNFTADLDMRGTNRFRNLSATITEVVNDIFRNNPNFTDIVVNGFARGSVLSDITITAQRGTITPAAAAQALANNADAFARRGLRLDANPVTNTTTTVPTTMTGRTTAVTMPTTPGQTVNQVPPQPFPSFAIAIIVMCILALIATIIAIVLCIKSGYWSKMTNAFQLESPDNLDLRLPMFGGRSYNFN